MSSYANLYVDQGADFLANVSLKNALGDPLDLTNYTVSGQVRRTYASETVYDFTIEINDPESGTVRMILDSDTTGSMGRGRYVYDVYGMNTNTDITSKFIYGILEVTPRVTRDG